MTAARKFPSHKWKIIPGAFLLFYLIAGASIISRKHSPGPGSPNSSAAKPFPAAPASYVYNEGVVSADAEQALSGRLRSVEEKTGHQFAAALFKSLEGESLEDYSNRLFRAWKIGDQKRNDGLLLCLFLQERRWRVEVGYGLEGTLTDLEAAEIAREYGVPHFRAGDFDGGVLAVADALAAKLSGLPGPKPPGGEQPLSHLFFLILLAIAFIYLSRYGGPGIFINSGGWSSGGWGDGGGGGWGGGGFSGGGGSSGGGGASGGW